jgi:acylphosphatase
MILSRKIRVHGRVQGVFFRKFIQDQVRDIGGIAGFVRNEPDGSVYMEVQGERDKIKDLVIACHRGNGESDVKKVDVHIAPVNGFRKFEVK